MNGLGVAFFWLVSVFFAGLMADAGHVPLAWGTLVCGTLMAAVFVARDES